jgi:hypothetical protein
MVTRAGRYEVFCVETGRGSHGSVFVCSITDLELGKEIGTVNFRVQRTPDRYVIVESPSSHSVFSAPSFRLLGVYHEAKVY